MNSLRTRIAVFYAALLVGVVALAAGTIAFAFHTLLLDQLKLRAQQTGEQIAQVANRSGQIAILDEVPIEQILANQYNIEHWASPTSFVQVDNAGGDIVGKSSNMGSLRFRTATALSASDDRTFSTVTSDFGPVLVLDRAILSGKRVVAVVHVGEQMAFINTTLQRANLILILVTVGAFLVVVPAAYLLARSAIDPIDRLRLAMQEIGSERLDRRLNWTNRSDEVGRLAATFDEMLARLEEAFARERQFVSDASHELKTPLTVINANAQMLARWADRDPVIRTESLAAIVGESVALAHIVDGMLTLAKATSGDGIPKEPISIGRLVRDVADRARDRAGAKGLALDVEIAPEAARTVVLGDDNLLRQLFNNLLDNAIKFTERGGVHVRLPAPRDQRAIVEVADTGVGLDGGEFERVFDRFYRTDRSHSRHVEGHGLGLAIVRSIVRAHNGEIVATPGVPTGTVFRVSLPIGPSLSPDFHDGSVAER